MSVIVKLNVGGQLFTTTQATLQKYPYSMLGAMFNDSFNLSVSDDGCHFIDRDGCLFIHVLNFLRCSALCLPDDFKHFDQLCLEADFYQIQPLIDQLEAMKMQRQEQLMDNRTSLEIIEVRYGTRATMPTSDSCVKIIIAGRSDILYSLPFVNAQEKLGNKSEPDFREIELSRANNNIRLKLGEYLQSNGWTLSTCDMSSSSAYAKDSKVVIEHTYRDRWVSPLLAS